MGRRGKGAIDHVRDVVTGMVGRRLSYTDLVSSVRLSKVTERFEQLNGSRIVKLVAVVCDLSQSL